ncbi:MAG: response regulator [Lentisphaerae bacterium]|nr:response regulator [Lentisphaerota bacterium]MBT4821789.1 response regulator [Lentisphaerota bacterium]MBT5609259.1 response regulator [Lentisphaerota bacterium]MBT7059447.1 response regulator [Lentisphaerota bacterium]MBT7847831.1 response regulator [Lentisphaerota bacterium]
MAVTSSAETGIPVLLLDRDPNELNQLSRAFDTRYAVHRAETGEQARGILRTEPVQVIVCGQKPGNDDGLTFLTEARAAFPQTQRILLLDNADPETVMKGVNEARVFRCLTRPVTADDLVEAVEFAALEYDILHTMDVVAAERDHLKAELSSWTDRSRRMAGGVTGILMHAGRLCIIGIAMLAAVLCVLTFLAVIALSAVYLCKTFLGIDLLQGLHLEDILYRLFGKLK